MNKKRKLSLFLALSLCFTLAAAAIPVHAAAKPGKSGWKKQMKEGEAIIFELKNDDGYTSKWSSSDRDVATVNKNGKVTARGEGTTVITARIQKKGKKDILLRGRLEVIPTIASMARKADMQAEDGKIVVHGYDWGPGVDQVVLELPLPVSRIAAKKAIVETKNVTRTVIGGYISDANGNRVDKERSVYVTLRLKTSMAESGSPFDYDSETTFMNSWTPDYPLNVRLAGKRGDSWVSIGYRGNCGNKTNIISPDTAGWKRLQTVTSIQNNPISGQGESVSLQRAAYEPEALAADGVKNPLIIWLHGQGEGGTDPDIVILGNKVSALTKDPIQGHFTTAGGANGAYVFIAQTPTYWMDEGNGVNGAGDHKSRYTEVLMDSIRVYLTENPDVDPDRIYLTGCSNGGYMTMTMINHYPDFFAAAIPNCEAYAFDRINSKGKDPSDTRWFTDKKAEKLKYMPLWFLASSDDNIVDPAKYSLPTYKAILNAGNDNCWFSYYDKVRMEDDPETDVMGHWVWVYFFNDEATGVQDPNTIKASADRGSFGFVPSPTGGTSRAVSSGRAYEDCFDWVNDQRLSVRLARQEAEKAAEEAARAAEEAANEAAENTTDTGNAADTSAADNNTQDSAAQN